MIPDKQTSIPPDRTTDSCGPIGSDPAALPPTHPQGLLRLRLQRLLGFLTLLPLCGLIVLLMRFLGGYRIENLPTIRRQFREIVREKTPLMICANHLTCIDSALILWALGSNFWYLFHYRYFSWNLPAGDFFARKWVFRFVAFLTKCIFLYRDGTMRHHKQVLAQAKHLLESGEIVTIFPEGRRSRSGRFQADQVVDGCGKIIASLGQCRVLCIYLRGDRQETYSDYPPRNSRFRPSLEVITPATTKKGRAAYFDLTHQIAATIQRQEERYFAQQSGRSA